MRAVLPGGHDNRTFRLGERMLMRLPSAQRYAPMVPIEQTWLARLAGQLPVPIPRPIAIGSPGPDYPWPWSVYGWLEGEAAETRPPADLVPLARDCAAFLTALWAIEAAEGPPPGARNFHRGAPPRAYDAETCAAIAQLGGQIDVGAASRLWDTALGSVRTSAPVWVHGDFSAGNILVKEGRLAGVIDFGCMAVGDPACDLVIAWTLFEGPSRDAFVQGADQDAQTWERARGWALWKALISLATPDAAASHETQARVLRALLADPD